LYRASIAALESRIRGAAGKRAVAATGDRDNAVDPEIPQFASTLPWMALD
jgi:hypothetical protein